MDIPKCILGNSLRQDSLLSSSRARGLIASQGNKVSQVPPGAKNSPSKPSVCLNLHITNFILKHVRQVVFNLKLCSINCVLGFSGGSEQKKKKKLLVNAGDRSWIPDLGRSHMPGEQGSPEVATAQPALYRRAAATTEPTCGITEAHMPWGLDSATREARSGN